MWPYLVSMFETMALVGTVQTSIRTVRVVPHNRPRDIVDAIGPTQLAQLFELGPRLWGDTYDPGLMETVVRDAGESDLLFGTRPETYSPLGALDAASLGRLEADERIYSDVNSPSGYRLRPREMLADGAAWCTLEREGEGVAAVAFGADAFVCQLPPETELVAVATQPIAPWERESEAGIREALHGAVSGKVTKHLMWRIYMGNNTARFDGGEPASRGLHRIRLGGTKIAGMLVGRLVYAIPMRASDAGADPFAQSRLARYEAKHQATTNDCPRIGHAIGPVSGTVGNLVVAVHGTMSTAVPLAEAARAAIEPRTPVVRFEHDTWRPIFENAGELAAEVSRLGARDVLFIAHSRGGLVARHAEALLRRSGTRTAVLSLGTPFLGTPIIDGVQKGLIGVRTLLGGLRLATASDIVDAPTRLLGWMLKGDLPAGLAAMRPGSEYLRTTDAFPRHRATRYAGRVVPPYSGDAYGVGFLSGFATAAFGKDDNDLVVAASSAIGDAPTGARIVDCDHFSYLLDQGVVDEISARARRLPAGFFRVETEATVPGTPREGDQLNW